MKAELVDLPEQRNIRLGMAPPSASTTMELSATADKWRPDIDFFKQKTNPGVKPYKFMDDLTFVGIPLFAAGWALKLGGYEGRSDWPRLLASAGMSYAIMAGFVNGNGCDACAEQPPLDIHGCGPWPKGPRVRGYG